MPWQQNLWSLINKPVGVSLADGTGVSGVLCSYDHEQIYLLQYLYHSQFATMHYSYDQIQNILPFPACQRAVYYYY